MAPAARSPGLFPFAAAAVAVVVVCAQAKEEATLKFGLKKDVGDAPLGQGSTGRASKLASFETAYWRQILEEGAEGKTAEEVREAARLAGGKVSSSANRFEALDVWAQTMAQTARSDPQALVGLQNKAGNVSAVIKRNPELKGHGIRKLAVSKKPAAPDHTSTKSIPTATYTAPPTLPELSSTGTQPPTSIAPVADADTPAAGPDAATASCIEEGVSWEPLDMPGSSATEEVDAAACQRRCLRTHGCYHFTFWKVYGHCHLQDAFALRRSGRKGFAAGPFQCWDEIKDHGLVKVKNGDGHSYLPGQFHCMEVGVSWAPAMRLPRRFEGPETDMIMQCQSFCAMTKSCARFTMEVGTRICHLATETATALPGVLNSISGPPVCIDEKKKDVFMKRKLQLERKYSDIGSVRQLASTTSLVTLLSAGVVLAGLARATLRWRGSPPWLLLPRGVLMEGMLPESITHQDAGASPRE